MGYKAEAGGTLLLPSRRSLLGKTSRAPQLAWPAGRRAPLEVALEQAWYLQRPLGPAPNWTLSCISPLPLTLAAGSQSPAATLCSPDDSQAP